MNRRANPEHVARPHHVAYKLIALALSGGSAWASDRAPKVEMEGERQEISVPAVLPQSLPTGPPRRAGLGQEQASAPAVQLADWVVDSRDNQDMPFMIIDKVNARVLLFDPSGRLRGAAAALLGQARGDDSTPGIGERPLSSILPAERTTPAGRFVASLDRDTRGQELLWVDYNTALALHRVVKGKPSEQRAERLESATPLDNRISYGCINVPAAFYDKFVGPTFSGTSGVVYILPETRSAREVFGSYEVTRQRPQLAASASSGVR
ncbi:hypothetical protein [Polaromonas sp.]|uniref:hypothetical protein n=1 Tax=Polaromonas sp. TaxID=1869339 RepID=UPI00375202B8